MVKAGKVSLGWVVGFRQGLEHCRKGMVGKARDTYRNKL